MVALLLTAPEGEDVSYTFAGDANVERGVQCDRVESNGAKFKLFLDKSTICRE